MIRLIIGAFAPFRWLIERMGIDYNQFILILKLKLTLDERSGKKSQNNTLFRRAIMQVFLGVMFAIFVNVIKEPFTFFYFTHTWIMVMMAMMIISEFTTVLFDTSENAIIQPLPVRGNTISLARNAHVFIYLAMMAFNLSLVTIVMCVIRFGVLSGLILIFSIFMNVLLTLFLSNILYLGIMRLASGEKLKNLLMYFQIVIAVVFMAVYQFGMKMIDTSKISEMHVSISWHSFLLPPAFFAGLVEGISFGRFDLTHFEFIAEAIVIPVTAIFITGKYLTPVFNRKLLELELGDRSTKKIQTNAGQGIYYRIMSRLFVLKNEEKVAFTLMWKLSGRERLFKQAVFPAFGYIIIMILVPFFSKHENLTGILKTDNYLFILYAFLILSATIPAAVMYGAGIHASWIFKILPVTSPAEIFKGSVKAAFALFFIPLYSVICIAVGVLWGIRVVPDIFVAFLSIYLFTLLYYYFQEPVFPFSKEKVAVNSGGNTMRMFGIFIIAVSVGFLHKFLLSVISHGSLLLIPVYIAIIIYVNRVVVYRRITWKTANKFNDYL